MVLAGLAKEFAVSPRTLSRDIAILRERGLPIETDRGRGGGIRLHWSWGIGRIALSYRETVALLVTLAAVGKTKSPLILADLSPVRNKILASLSPELKEKVKKLSSRLLVGESASPMVLTNFASLHARILYPLHQAFIEMKPLEIRYRTEDGKRTRRVIEAHYLLLHYPVWYVLAYDRLRGAIRTFRCDRMEAAEMAEGQFRLKSRLEFEPFIDAIGAASP